MTHLQPTDIFEIVQVSDDSQFRKFASKNPKGIALVEESYGESTQPVLKSSAGDFAKWVAAEYPSVPISLPANLPRLVLRSGDIWLPLVFLASDIALPVYLNMVANYLYDKMKGALKGEKQRVHLSAVYEDKAAGIVKRFDFEGDQESLQKAIAKFNVNKFLND